MSKKKRGKAGQLLHMINYLPRGVWYVLSFFIGGPFGVIVLLIVFHVLEQMAKDEEEEAKEREKEEKNARHKKHQGVGTYVDEDCVVTDDEQVRREWQQAQDAPESAQEAQSPNLGAEDVSDVIRAGQEALRRIHHADEMIADEKLSAQIASIEESCRQILSILEARPQVLPQLRTFLRYYLPTTLKLLDARSKLEHSANTPKAREVSRRISEAIAAIDKAFQKQVDALDEYRFIDLESEMDVLRDMLRSDGLIDEDDAENDPFFDELSTHGRKHQGGEDIPLAGH